MNFKVFGPPKLVFGLWLDRPGHQDGALGHHAGVLHDSPGYLFEIMQDIPQFVGHLHARDLLDAVEEHDYTEVISNLHSKSESAISGKKKWEN